MIGDPITVELIARTCWEVDRRITEATDDYLPLAWENIAPHNRNATLLQVQAEMVAPSSRTFDLSEPFEPIVRRTVFQAIVAALGGKSK